MYSLPRGLVHAFDSSGDNLVENVFERDVNDLGRKVPGFDIEHEEAGPIIAASPQPSQNPDASGFAVFTTPLSKIFNKSRPSPETTATMSREATLLAQARSGHGQRQSSQGHVRTLDERLAIIEESQSAIQELLRCLVEKIPESTEGHAQAQTF